MSPLLLILIGSITLFGVYLYHFWTQRQKRQAQLKRILAKKQEQRAANFEWARKRAAMVDERTRKSIEKLSYAELKAKLQSGSIKCVDVCRTYYYKALVATEKTNSVCTFVKEAEDEARRLDELAKNPSYKKPALFGMPISLKETVPLKDYESTRGFVQDIGKISCEDAVMVQQMKRHGAIIFCQTNVPQSLLSFMCSNPVYGLTTNPFDASRTSGGSSGGESALIAANGSLIGVGGDVGGSIRIPCAFTGISGIKPSHTRFSHRGTCGSVPGRPLINSNDGPMTKSILASIDFLKVMWSDNWATEQDPYVPPVLWNEKLYSSEKKLRIGYYLDDGWFTPTPASQRAVLKAKAILESAGHTLIPFEVPNSNEVPVLFLRAVCVDGGRYLSRKLINDIVDPLLYGQLILWLIPLWIHRLLSHIMEIFYPRLASIMRSMTLNTEVLRETYAKIEEYRSNFTNLMLKKQFDAILSPATVSPALPHNAPMKLFATATYTGLYNLLDYSAGVVPVTKVTKEDEENLESKYPTTDPWYRIVKNCSKNTIGLPMAVQIATRPFHEETCLRLLYQIEKGVNATTESSSSSSSAAALLSK